MNHNKLKYSREIKELGLKIDCPYKDCSTINTNSFRWIKMPLKNINNYLPRIILNYSNSIPLRRNDLSDNSKCSDCGLSMFNSKENAIRKFFGFPERIRKNLGYTHIASCNISEEDGLSSKINLQGHFDFFEFVDINLADKFELIGELVDG